MTAKRHACLLLGGLWLAAPIVSAHPDATFCRNANPVFVVGNGSSLELEFDVQEGDLELYKATVTLPADFQFNGFAVLGGADAEIGRLTVGALGIVLVEAPLRIYNADIAYVDVNDSGARALQEPILAHAVDPASGAHVFTLWAYFGGDRNPDTHHQPAAGTSRLVLDTGILTPPAGGTHTITASLESVDPDNDGADNGTGAAPSTCTFSASFTGFADPIVVTQQIAVDIKPGGSPNSVNPGNHGVIPVAILTTDTFDAGTVDALSVRFGPDGASEAHGRGHAEDVDDDGDLDMVLHFRTQETGISCGDTSAGLTGETVTGASFEGFDSIRTVDCREAAKPEPSARRNQRRKS